MTSHALSRLAGSRRTLLHAALQQRAAGGRHGHCLGSAILRRIRNPTRPTSIYAHLLEEQSCQISSGSDLKRRSHRLFIKERRHNKKMNNNNKISSLAILYMGSVPGSKSCSSSHCGRIACAAHCQW